MGQKYRGQKNRIKVKGVAVRNYSENNRTNENANRNSNKKKVRRKRK